MRTVVLSEPLIHIFSRFYQDIKSKGVSMKHTLLLLATFAGKKDLHILLADDDDEDREIFVEAITEIAPHVKVTVALNGQQLMKVLLKDGSALPDIIFLDLNMPLKNGQECLSEIRSHQKLNQIPVIIYSTSSSREHINETFKGGADFYVPKPDSFTDLKKIVKKIFALDWDNHARTQKDQFVLKAT